jgi:hypothetical protein
MLLLCVLCVVMMAENPMQTQKPQARDQSNDGDG